MNDESRSTKFLEDYAPPDYLIKQVSLDVRLAPKDARIASTLSIEPNADTAAGTPLVLDGEALTLERVAVNGQDLEPGRYTLAPGKLTIANPPMGAFTLDIVTRCDPEANTELQGLYLSSGVYCTQCEPEGFRRITYFLDRPDVLSVYSVRLEADARECPVLLANGNPLERGTLAGGERHYAVWKDPHPKPCYLFAVVGGAISRRSTTVSPPPLAARSRSASMSSPARKTAATGPWSR